LIVAIHQPNYLPWLGYFRKIALADVFVFLDDVQFSKNSYTNRVRILGDGRARWLSVPVSVHLGDTIRAVHPARADWSGSHLDTLKTFYRHAPAFNTVWPRVQEIYHTAPSADIAGINRALVEAVAGELGLACRFLASSDLDTGEATGDDRLARIVSDLAPGGTYLSGEGGSKYQDPGKFEAAGITLRYPGFQHPTYDQGGTPFVAGLSVLDAAFRLGWRGAAGLLVAETETV
jgi:hypothetical protein